jgi:membrane-bound lytic murein transglycosylase B
MQQSRFVRRRRALVSVAAWLVVVIGAAVPPAAAQDQGLAAWLEELRREAIQNSIREQTLDVALAGVEPIARVIELDRRQPEVTQTFAQYMKLRVTPELVAEGKSVLGMHRALLERVGRKYGVPPRFIVALWGVETRYGKYSGSYPVIGALATLAYDTRRGSSTTAISRPRT